MKHRGILSYVGYAFIALALGLAVEGAALAAEGGHGGGGGGHFGGGGGRAYGGHFGGYGYRYGGGWRGGYGYYGPWGWGGYGYGLFLATLPLYYSTYWWNGVPYYYADSNYYLWNAASGGYESVQPPPGVAGQTATQEPGAAELFAYPKNNQSQEQQAQDRFECHRWAREQSGFDPTQPGGAVPPSASTPAAAVAAATGGPPAMAPSGSRQDYVRAQTACLEARGYSVR